MVSLPLVEVGVNCMCMGGVGEGVEGKLTIWTREKESGSDRPSLDTLSLNVGDGDCDSGNFLLGFVLVSCSLLKFTLLEETG